MKLDPSFRAATANDCSTIAQLFSIASDGVSNYFWSTLQVDYPGLSLIEIGTNQFAIEQTDFSYQNCVVVECDGKVIGMMVTFPVGASKAESECVSEVANPLQISSSEPNVLEPYYCLKAPGTWYIAGLAVFPEFRGQGVGTQLLSLARQQAQEQGFQELSLLAFEQNIRAVKLYKRNEFKIIDCAFVVPHELIHYTGSVLLMTAPL
jgi:ribosomal protein S18 acetylase RimI-like enzyme